MNQSTTEQKLRDIVTDISSQLFVARSTKKPIGMSMHIIDEAVSKLEALLEQTEIDLLRDTANGFESELQPEYEKGGRAAINALRAMADHKEAYLRKQNKQTSQELEGDV